MRATCPSDVGAFSRRCLAVLLTVALVAGCGSGGSDDSTEPAADDPTSETHARIDEAIALANGPDDERDAALAAGSDEVVAIMLDAGGISEALGAEEARAAAAEVFAGVLPEMEDISREDLGLASAESLFQNALSQQGGATGTGVDGSTSAAFVGFMTALVTAMTGTKLSNDIGARVIKGNADGFGVEIDRGRVSMQNSTTKTLNGIDGTIDTDVNLTPCPDPDGKVSVKATIDVGLYVAGSREGGRSELDITVDAQVNDDAVVTSSDLNYRFQMSDTRADGKGVFLDASESIRLTGREDMATATASVIKEANVNRTGGDITRAQAQSYYALMFKMAIIMQEGLLYQAKDAWESGRCVDLQVTTDPATRTGLAPSAPVEVTATPTSKIDGTPTGGTITAEVTGGTSITPTGKTGAPAAFAYIAPGEKDKAATITLEARSKRGVAKATIDFDTKAKGWVASGGGGGLVVTGQVSSLTEPFSLTGTFPGGSGTFTYTPTDERSGTYRSSFSGSGVTGSTSGTYTIAGDAGSTLTLTGTGDGCVQDIGGSCRNTTEVITLTPAT